MVDERRNMKANFQELHSVCAGVVVDFGALQSPRPEIAGYFRRKSPAWGWTF